MIEFKDVELSLNGKEILNKISFKIDKGQSVLLIGNSGAGKSTILKLLLGLIQPVSGEISVFGKNIAELSTKELMKLRQKCGMVFQGGALFDSLTVEENVGFFLRESQKLSREEVYHGVMEKLEYLHLDTFKDYYPAQLSGGMKKRVAIARAITSGPDVMLYDEPTAGLDPQTATRVVGLIDDLRHRFNVTSLIVSHEIHYFMNVVDRMMLLRNGVIEYDGVPDLESVSDKKKTEFPFALTEVMSQYGII